MLGVVVCLPEEGLEEARSGDQPIGHNCHRGPVAGAPGRWWKLSPAVTPYDDTVESTPVSASVGYQHMVES